MRSIIFFFVLSLGLMATAHAEKQYIQVQIADPYIELRTGPGRGFPIFYVAERGEWISIIKRKTDWFKVRTPSDKIGWVNRAQLESTLTKVGTKTTFRDVVVKDYLERRVEVGFSWGRFDKNSVLAIRAGYGLTPNFFSEISASQVTAAFSTTSLLQLNLLAIPFAENRISPFFTLGIGRYKNSPKVTLVNSPDISVTAANVGVGVRIYLTRSFLLRGDFREYVAPINDNRVDSFREWTIGIGVFF